MLNFTRQERVVIYFLVITLGLGAILRIIRNRIQEDELRSTRFYQEAEQFKAIAEQINADSIQIIESKDSSARDTQVSPAVGKTSTGEQLRININAASIEELCALPGIGPGLAQRIKAYTDQHGPFKHTEEIVLVKGIGQKLYARIEGLVTTE